MVNVNFDKPLVAMRPALAEHIIAQAARYPIVLLTADLGQILGVNRFCEHYPDRYIDVGIAEQNMMSVATGLALSGQVPIVASFGTYLSMRCLEQVRSHVCYQQAKVILLGYHGGLSASQNGATHQAIEDLNVMRLLPHMTVYAPADAAEACEALNLALDSAGPSYIRLSREAFPLISASTSESYARLGVRKLASGAAFTMVTTGTIAHECLRAVKSLRNEGIAGDLFHLPTIKPFDGYLIEDSLRQTRHLITVEEGLLAGGIGDLLSGFFAERKIQFDLNRIGLNDVFGESGTYQQLLDKHGLTAKKIADTVKQVVAGVSMSVLTGSD